MSKIQNGVTSKMRMKRVVSAGRVVAEVAVRWVERKSVMIRNGSSSMLHLPVSSCTVSTISSSDLCCGDIPEPSDGCLLWLNFSPVLLVEESGEYRREYMPRMRKVTRIIGPPYRRISSP